MFNSYTNTFGKISEDCSEAVNELLCEITSHFDWKASVEDNTKAFVECIKTFTWAESDEEEEVTLTLTNNDKAHILDGAFHFANENFYELEDDGEIDDRFDTQADFLEALENALKDKES